MEALVRVCRWQGEGDCKLRVCRVAAQLPAHPTAPPGAASPSTCPSSPRIRPCALCSGTHRFGNAGQSSGHALEWALLLYTALPKGAGWFLPGRVPGATVIRERKGEHSLPGWVQSPCPSPPWQSENQTLFWDSCLLSMTWRGKRDL